MDDYVTGDDPLMGRLCDTCDRFITIEFLSRINPPPFDELIVCDTCYDWRAWRFLLDDSP